MKQNKNMEVQEIQKRKSEKLTKEEKKTLKTFIKGFDSFTAAALTLNMTPQVLTRVVQAGSGAPDTIEKVRKGLSNGQA